MPVLDYSFISVDVSDGSSQQSLLQKRWKLASPLLHESREFL
jgi:hypothetical protein